MHPTLNQAIAALTEGSCPYPDAAALVAALLETEKNARKTKPGYTYPQLIGTWQLRFITGTRRSRQRAGIMLGAGRFIPDWLVQIRLRYSELLASSNPSTQLGQVQNSVRVGPLCMTLTGPTCWWPQTNSLGFDFTHIRIQLGQQTVYESILRGGTQKEQDFATQKLKNQAFFTYFWVSPSSIAARGRGGGLALWTRIASSA